MSYISANSAIWHLYFYQRHVNVLKPSCVVYDVHWCTKFIVAGYHWIQWRYRFRVTMSTHSLAFLSASLELLRSLTFYPLWVTTGHSESFYLSLTLEVWSEAPETRPLPAISRAHPPASLTDCPAASNGGGRFPWLVVQGQISYCTSPVTLPSVAPSPGRFATFRACYCPLCWLIDGVPAGDPAPITPVKAKYSGKVESLNRDPGMHFPGN